MANAIYPKYKEGVLQSTSGTNMSSGTVKAALVDTNDYTYSTAHDFFDDVSSAVVGTPVEITSKTFTDGVFDGADVTLTSVSGDQSEGLVIYIDTGTPSTSRLIAYLDTSITGLPVTPNGGDITITWDNGSNKIFRL